MDNSKYRKLLNDIVKGFTESWVFNKNLYIKHQHNSDIVGYDQVYQNYFNKASLKGLPTEKEILDNLNSEGIWTKEDEIDISKSESFIESLILNKKNLVLQSAIDSVNKQIDQEKEKLEEKKLKKTNLFSNSCEQFATNRANDYFMHKSFFKDKECKELFFEEDEFEYLSAEQVKQLVFSYNSYASFASETEIQNLSIQPFYKMYYPFSESCMDFFGKPIVNLSTNQMTLLLYTRVFKNIFEQNENIPEKILSDPQALLDYANSADKREDLKSKLQSNDSAGSTVFGATREDLDNLGVQSSEAKSLSKTAKEKGGTLNMKDLMDLSGI